MAKNSFIGYPRLSIIIYFLEQVWLQLMQS